MAGRRIGAVAATAAAGAVGWAVVRGVRHRRAAQVGQDDTASDRWHAVTINRPPEEVLADGRWPEPLDSLAELVEVEVRAAPGTWGSELRVRLRDAPTGVEATVRRVAGTDPRQRVRAALRETKQLLEVGEVLRLEPFPHGRRPSTPGGKLIEFAARRASGEGLL